MKKFWFVLVLLLAACTTPAQQQDLLVNSQYSRMTADAALRQAEYQEQALTATAQAPVIWITETAAGMVVQQQYWTATAQSVQQTQISAMTQTAISWTPTPDATQTSVFVALNAQSTQMALELERQETSNQFRAIIPGISIVVVIFAAIMGLMWLSRRERYRPAAVDVRGNILPVFDYVDGTVTDPDRMPNYRGDLHEDWIKQWLMNYLNLKPQLPAVTPERQDAATQRDQLSDLAVRGLPSSTSPQSAQKRMAAQEMTKQLSTTNLEGRFKVLDAQQNELDIVDGQIIETLDMQWKEAHQK